MCDMCEAVNQRSSFETWCPGYLMVFSHIGMWCPHDRSQLLSGVLESKQMQNGPRPETYKNTFIRLDSPRNRQLFPGKHQGPVLSLGCAGFEQPEPAELVLYCTLVQTYFKKTGFKNYDIIMFKRLGILTSPNFTFYSLGNCDLEQLNYCPITQLVSDR